jgi:hypothetical protein
LETNEFQQIRSIEGIVLYSNWLFDLVKNPYVVFWWYAIPCVHSSSVHPQHRRQFLVQILSSIFAAHSNDSAASSYSLAGLAYSSAGHSLSGAGYSWDSAAPSRESAAQNFGYKSRWIGEFSKEPSAKSVISDQFCLLAIYEQSLDLKRILRCS